MGAFKLGITILTNGNERMLKTDMLIGSSYRKAIMNSGCSIL